MSTSTANARPAAPFPIAHRAGNDLQHLREAERLGIRLIEADLRLFRGKLEVRHLKTLGPVPLLWDRWKLAPPWTPRLALSKLLEVVAPQTELVLDLKGRDPRLAQLVLAELSRHRPRTQVQICARSWGLLEAFEGVPSVRTVYSVGNARQLRRLRRRFAQGRIGGVSIHQRLLTHATVGELRGFADLVLTWPVNTAARARELAAWGVDGVITDSPQLADELTALVTA